MGFFNDIADVVLDGIDIIDLFADKISVFRSATDISDIVGSISDNVSVSKCGVDNDIFFDD